MRKGSTGSQRQETACDGSVCGTAQDENEWELLQYCRMTLSSFHVVLACGSASKLAQSSHPCQCPTPRAQSHPTQPPSITNNSEKKTFVKNVVREVAGFAPYEKRVMELLRNSKDKKAKKLTKKRLGTLLRSKRKVEELSNIIQEQRRQTGH